MQGLEALRRSRSRALPQALGHPRIGISRYSQRARERGFRAFRPSIRIGAQRLYKALRSPQGGTMPVLPQLAVVTDDPSSIACDALVVGAYSEGGSFVLADAAATI